MGKLTFLLGGARSGKSSCAQRLAKERGGRVLLIATATPGDSEMAARILQHQKERPAGWATREIPLGVAAALNAAPPQADIILLDCLTMLVNNLLLQDSTDEIDEAAASLRVENEITSLSELIRESRAEWLIVSNEVGLGLVPPYPLGRSYRDLLGRANQQLAAFADEVFWMVAGIPVPIHAYRLK